MRGARVAMGASLGALVLGCVALGQAQEVKVTSHDRLWENFKREAAVVDAGQFRAEVFGISLHAEPKTRHIPQVIIRGTPAGEIDRHEVREDLYEVNGGKLGLIASFGVFDNAEVGAQIEGIFQGLRFQNPDTGSNVGGESDNDNEFGDMWIYGKYVYPVNENLGVGGGVEARLPTGNKANRIGTGEVGTNPFAATRYSDGRWAVGGNVGYQFNTGNLDDMFNWSADALLRAGAAWGLRAEFTGWHYNYGGTHIDNVYCSPGIEYSFSQNWTVRPQGQVGITKPALGWGLGVGIAYTF